MLDVIRLYQIRDIAPGVQMVSGVLAQPGRVLVEIPGPAEQRRRAKRVAAAAQSSRAQFLAYCDRHYNARCETTHKVAQEAPCVRPSRWLLWQGHVSMYAQMCIYLFLC